MRSVFRVLWLLLVVFGATALAYFVVPAASLRVVGIASRPPRRQMVAVGFCAICRQNKEPTSGLQPLT